MVNWDNEKLLERLALLIWPLVRDKLTPEVKDTIIRDLAQIDSSVTWNSLR